MGLFDKLMGGVEKAAEQVSAAAAGQAAEVKSETFTFSTIPTSVAELKALPEASLDSPFKTTALALLALLYYEKDVNATVEMLNFLKGPDPVSEYEKQFLKDRLAGKYYKPYSFFAGASVENGYEPSMPLKITVSSNPYSYPEPNWATLYVKSAGADSERPVKLRLKPSAGTWYLNDIQCLSDIRIPANEDPWA